MKKSMVPVLFALIPALVLAGCSKKAAKNDGPVTLKVWESDKGPDEFIKKAGEAYTKTHPNVTIEYVHVELGDAAGQIALDGPAGVGPDLFAAPHDKLGELVNSGHVAATVNPAAVKNEVLGACAQAFLFPPKHTPCSTTRTSSAKATFPRHGKTWPPSPRSSTPPTPESTDL